jgi:hypothetical protein
MKRIPGHVLLAAMLAGGLLSCSDGMDFEEAETGSVSMALKTDRGGHSAATPRIHTLSPSPAQPGDRVTIHGANLMPNPVVLVNGQEVVSEKSSSKGLSFQLPALDLVSCKAKVSVVVSTDRGSSTAAFLAVRGQSPRLKHPGREIGRGRAVVFNGLGLSGATFSLGGQNLVIRESSDTHAAVIIPNDQALGRTLLVVASDCGRDEAKVKVVKAPAQIVSIDPPSVAPAGILEVTTDVTDPSLITSAQLGLETFPATDPGLFRVVPNRDPLSNVVVALRIPATMEAQWLKLRLIGPAGTSDVAAVEVAIPAGPVPTPPLEACVDPPARVDMSAAFALIGSPIIMYPPRVAGDGETFPFGTRGRTYAIGAPAADYWGYFVTTLDTGYRECTPRPGSISGWEIYCKGNTCESPHLGRCAEFGGDLADPNLHCHPFVGRHSLSPTENFIELEIDRTPSGGVKETYVGGWGQGDSLDPPRVPSGSREANACLVLRSKLTGLQLTIRHGVDPGINCPAVSSP